MSLSPKRKNGSLDLDHMVLFSMTKICLFHILPSPPDASTMGKKIWDFAQLPGCLEANDDTGNTYLVNIGIYLLRWKISSSFLSYLLEYPQKFTFWGCFPYCFLGFLPHQSNCPTVQRQRPSKPALPTDQSRQALKTLFFFRFLPFFVLHGMVLSTCRKKNKSPGFSCSGTQKITSKFVIRSASLRLASCGYLNQYLKGETCRPFGWAKPKMEGHQQQQKKIVASFPDLSGSLQRSLLWDLLWI